MKYLYYINGWEESRSFFMSFGFTKDEIEKMMNGEVIKRYDNEFWMKPIIVD